MTIRVLLPPSVGTARAEARAELLSASLAGDRGEPPHVRVAEDYGELVSAVRAGEVDVLWAPPMVVATLGPHIRAVLACVRRGRSSYRSCIVARSGTRELEALSGKVAAWVDPRSIGGHLLATALLRARGLEPSTFFREQRFLGSFPAAVHAVLESHADVCAITVSDESRAATEESLDLYGGRAARTRLVSLATTSEVPNDGVAITSALEGARAEQLMRRLCIEGDRMRAAFLLALEADTFREISVAHYAPLSALAPR